MTATSQHGLHPDAESLSAFSEQALGKRERAEVLAHLAVCGRCRQVVALAREAAGAERRETMPRRPAKRSHLMRGGSIGGWSGFRQELQLPLP